MTLHNQCAQTPGIRGMMRELKGARYPPHQYFLLPIGCGTAWLITLCTLLFFWLGQGRPQYPFQKDPEVAYVSLSHPSSRHFSYSPSEKTRFHSMRYTSFLNTDCSFISDIGAHGTIKPAFIAGGIITALSFTGTIFAANSVRHHYIDDTKSRKILAGIATVGALMAGLTLILLTIFDTDRFHNVHTPLLLFTFLGIAISGFATAVVYWDTLRGDVGNEKGRAVRKWSGRPKTGQME